MTLAANPVDFVLPLLQRKRAAGLMLGEDIVTGSSESGWRGLLIQTLSEAVIMKAIQELHPTIATNEAWDTRFGPAALNDPGGLWPGLISRAAFPPPS